MGLFEELAKQANDVSSVASDKELESLGDAARKYVELEQRKALLDAEMKTLNAEILEYKHKTLPDIMTGLDMDHYGLASAGVDIELGDYAKANISADWDEERQEAGFKHLEELQVGDIIRLQVSYSFGKDQYDEAKKLVELVAAVAEAEDIGIEIPTPTVKKSVPWNTLTATLKELHKKGVAVDLEKIGGVIGKVVKIKERK